MTTKFSPFICGFRKSHNAQYSLLKMIETWKNHLDQGKKIGAIFMDLSKAFDTIDHSLLLAKMKAYGFSTNSLRLLQSYLCHRYQRVNINGSFSEWKMISVGVPQGSILGPLFFNIFINDIFLIPLSCSISNYADDNTLYAINDSMSEIKLSLSIDFSLLMEWFDENHMVLNPDKCHYMIFGHTDANDSINLNGNEIMYKEHEDILGV